MRWLSLKRRKGEHTGLDDLFIWVEGLYMLKEENIQRKEGIFDGTISQHEKKVHFGVCLYFIV